MKSMLATLAELCSMNIAYLRVNCMDTNYAKCCL